MIEEELNAFFFEFANRVKTLGDAIRFCRLGKENNNPLVKLLSIALLWVFTDIKGYLDDYEIDISKGAGFPYEVENEKVRTSILLPFAESIRKHESSFSTGDALQLVEQIIITWERYDKEAISA